MACVGAYECLKCGDLVFVGNAEVAKHYGQVGEHVCDPKDIAEKRYMDNPRLSFEDAFDPGGSAASRKERS